MPPPKTKPIPLKHLPQTEVIAVDLNRIGEYMVAFNIPVRNGVPKRLLQFKEKYDRCLDEIRKLQNHDPVRKFWYGKRSRYLKESRAYVARLIATVVVETQAKALVTEKLDFLSPTGKKGKLGKAVTSMPKAKVVEKALAILRSWNYPVSHIQVNPWWVKFNIHHECGGKLDRDVGWDRPPCTRCGKSVNSHTNAARLLVDYGRKIMEANEQSRAH